MALLLSSFVQSAYAQISVRSALSDDREVRPDSVYEGAIQVWNETDELQEAKIYQTDYLFFGDGTNRYGEAGHDERSNANWIRVSASSLTIPPHGRTTVSYVVDVPDSVGGAPASGSYWSMIMVEGVPKESPEATINPITGEPQYSVLQVTRYGIQVATHIVDTGDGNLALSAGGLVQLDDGGLTMEVSLENTGTRFLQTDTWIELYDDQGAAFGRHEGGRARIYPGTSVKRVIRLGTLEPGDYRALVIAYAGESDVFGAEYRLQVE